MTWDGKILRGLFEDERLKPEIIRTTQEIFLIYHS